MAALTFRAPQKGVPRGLDGKAVVLEVVIRVRNVQQLTCWTTPPRKWMALKRQ